LTCVVYVVTIVTAGVRYGLLEDFPYKETADSKGVLLAEHVYRAGPVSFCAPFTVMSRCLLAFAYQPCIPTVRVQMKRPERMGFSLKVACLVTFSVYVLAGAGGYYGFGDKTHSESVLNNMIGRDGSKIPEGLFLSSAVVFNLFATFVILMNVVNRAAENAVVGKYCAPVRLVLVAMCAGIAIFMPHFGVLMSFIGAIPVCMLLTLVPLLIFWKLVRDHGVEVPHRNVQIAWHCVVVIFGLCCLVIGSMEAVVELIQKLKDTEADPFWV